MPQTCTVAQMWLTWSTGDCTKALGCSKSPDDPCPLCGNAPGCACLLKFKASKMRDAGSPNGKTGPPTTLSWLLQGSLT